MGASKSTESQQVNERRWERRQSEHIGSMEKDLVQAQEGLRNVHRGPYPSTPIHRAWLTMAQAVWCLLQYKECS